MQKFNLLVVKNKILFNVLNEVKFFYNYEVFYSDSINYSEKKIKNSILLLFYEDFSLKNINEIALKKPAIVLVKNSDKILDDELYQKKNIEFLSLPINIESFISKIKIYFLKKISLEKSIVNIKNYILDTNKREIKRNDLKLKLTEREINFIIYLNNLKAPCSIKEILFKVWNYSYDVETHTIETHIHRLRKKFIDKFQDKFIQNNKRGYYI